MAYDYSDIDNLYNTGLFEFASIFNVNEADLNATASGSGVHLNKNVTIDLNILDRQSGDIDSATDLLSNSYVNNINVDILDITGGTVYPSFLSDYKSNTFSFTEYDNINVFGDYAKHFGVKATVVDRDLSEHVSEFYFYGNNPVISGITIQDSTGTTSHSASKSAKSIVNSVGQTGALTATVTFLNNINYVAFDRLEMYSSTTSAEFDPAVNTQAVFARNLTNEGTQSFDIKEGILPNGEDVYLHFLPYGRIDSGEAWTVGPYRFEDNPLATNQYITKDDTGEFLTSGDLEDYLTGEAQSLQDVTTIGSGTTNNITFSGSVYGTGDGNRITTNGVPYLLASSNETTPTLQSVTDNGATTTNLVKLRPANGAALSINDAVYFQGSSAEGGSLTLESNKFIFNVSGSSDENSAESNEVNSYGSTIVLGTRNKIFGDYDGIVAGTTNIISGSGSNTANYGFVGAGSGMLISESDFSSIVGGADNTIQRQSHYSFIGGGTGNTLDASAYSVIGGGVNNYIQSSEAVQVFGSYISGNTEHNGYIYLSDNDNRTKTPTRSDALFIDFTGGVDIKTGDLTVVNDVSISGDITSVDSVQFDTGAGTTVGQAQLAWNSQDLTLDLGLDSNVTLQVGQEQLIRVKCVDPSGVYDGMAVYAAGTIGASDNIEIERFTASYTGVDELYFVGVATEDMAENAVGFVTTFGKVREVDGRAFGTGQGVKDPADTGDWALGDILWVSPNQAGTLTTIKPPAPNRRMAVAMVLAAPNQTNITLMVRAEHGYHLDEIHDIRYNSQADRDLLLWNASDEVWENGTLTSGDITGALGFTPSSTDDQTLNEVLTQGNTSTLGIDVGAITGSNLTIDDYVYHDGDANTYFGFETDDVFRIVAAGSEKFQINTSRLRISNNDIHLNSDSNALKIGVGEDLQLLHNGSSSSINNYVGNLFITNNADDADIIFRSDDGAGGVTEYLRIDGSNTNMLASKTMIFADSVKASFGNSEDLRIYHNGVDSYIGNYVGDLEIFNGQDDGDISFVSDNGSGGTATYMRIDGGTTTIQTFKDLLMTVDGDGGKIKFGASQDLQIYHNGTNSEITHNNTGDLLFKTYVNNMQLINYATDGDITFRSDDGAGSTTEYFRIDGGDTNVTFSKNIKLGDSVKAIFGGGNDLQIYHDGSNSWISEVGAGSLITAADNFYLRNAAGNETKISAISNGAVNLYYDNVNKLSTTASGVSITDGLDVTGDITMAGDTVATQDWVTGQGYLTSETDDQTLDEVLTQGNVSSQEISVGSITGSGDFYVYGDAGGSLLWDKSENTLNITHDSDDAGLEIYTTGTSIPTTHQVKIGRASNQYLGIRVDDSSSYIIHRQDETDSTVAYTRNEIWSSSTGEKAWRWYVAANDGTSASEKMELNNSAELTLGGGSNTITNTKVGQWDSAYTYSQVGHLSLSGGTLTGDVIFDDGSGDSPALKFRDGSDINFSIYHSSSNTLLITREGNSGADFAIHANATDYTNSYISIGGSQVTPTLISNWSTAYTYSQVGHLPLAGGTMTGALQVSVAGASGINLQQDTVTSTNSGRLFFSNATSGQGVSIYNVSGAMRFQTGATFNSSTGSTRMTIGTGGNVGIGTTTPAAKLDVNGAITNSSGNVRIESVSGQEVEIASTRDIRLLIDSNNDDTTNRFEIQSNTSTSNDSNIVFVVEQDGQTIIDGGVGVASSGTLHLRQKGNSASDGLAITSSSTTSHRIWKDASGKLNIGPSSDSDAFVQDLSGNVGIGTTSPYGNLNINTGTSGVTTNISSQLAGSWSFGNQSGSSAAPTLIGKSNNNVGALFIGATNDSNTSGDMHFNVRENDGTDFSTTSSIAFKFQRYATDLMTILRNGNVGIGTTGPASPLSVQASSTAAAARLIGRSSDNIATLDFYNNAETGSIYLQGNGSWFRSRADGGFHFAKGATPTTSDADGFTINGLNVGIGTTSPSNPLHVSVSGDNGVRIDSDSHASLYVNSASSTSQYIRFSENNSAKYWIQSTSGVLRFRPSGTSTVANQVIFDSSGRVGIGVSPSSAELEVNGHFMATTKSFIIDNPKTGGKLQYGVVESDQHSVLVRGKNDTNDIELPEEWEWLVDPDSITVHLTSIGQIQQLFVISQDNKKIKIGGLATNGQYNYTVYGERVDVDKLQVNV